MNKAYNCMLNLTTMYNSGFIKKGLFALALVFFIGQSAVQAQSVAEASRLIDNEKYDKAKEVLNKIIANDPRNEKADYLMGKVYFNLEQFGPAKAWFSKGVGHGQRYPWNHIGLGAVAVKNSNLGEAKTHLASAEERNKSNDPEILMGIAEAYMGWPGTDKTEQGKYLKEAELYLYKVQKLDPNNAKSFVLLGQLYSLQGVDELEQMNYESAIQRDDKFLQGYYRLGVLYKKQEKYNQAADNLEKAIALDPGYAPPYKEMAEMWFLAKKYDRALEKYNKYLELMENDLGARLRLGVFQYLGEQYDKAIGTMETVLKDTNSILLLRLLGYCNIRKEPANPDKGIEWLTRYFNTAKPISYIPSDYEHMGMAYGQKGEDSLAVMEYEKAMKLAEEKEEPKPELLATIADIYKKSKRWDKQAEYLERYIPTIGKYKLKENYSLGRAYYFSKNHEKSDSVFAIMTEKRPDVIIGWSWRAKNNSAMDPENKEGKAKPYFEKVLEVIGDDEESRTKYQRDFLDANRYLGAYYTLTTEDFSAAIPYWEAILQVKPEDEGAQNGLDYCKKKGG